MVFVYLYLYCMYMCVTCMHAFSKRIKSLVIKKKKKKETKEFEPHSTVESRLRERDTRTERDRRSF